MRYQNTGLVLKACQMSFNGVKNNDIAEQLGVDPSMVSRWRKFPIWIEFHEELFDAERKALLDAQLRSGAKAENLAQG